MYKFWDSKDHIQNRSMWAGSQHLGMSSMWVYRDEFPNYIGKADVLTSKALVKIIDELRVNSLDQYTRFPEHVTKIAMTLSPNGEFSILNDGPGFKIYFEEKIKKYSVEGLFTELFSSSNFEKDPYRVVGGVNGCGLKVVLNNCEYALVETCDNGQLYKQKFTPDVTSKPTIEKYKGKPYTKVTIMPNYNHLCKSSDDTQVLSQADKDAIVATLDEIVHAMAYMTALFINSVEHRTDAYASGELHKILYKKKAAVFYQDKEIKPNFALDVSMNLPGTFSWKVHVGLNDGFETFSLINGVIIQGGSHIDLLYSKIREEIETRIQKKYKNLLNVKSKLIKDNIFIADMRFIPTPNFEGQTKNSIDIDAETIRKMRAEYKLPKQAMDTLFDLLAPILEDKQSKKKTSKKIIRKYEKAELCRKEPEKCFLFIPEGDSAAKPISDIIHSKKTKLDGRYYGMYNIQGVPPNAKKETTVINGRVLKSKMLTENKSFEGLVSALNLDYAKKYESDADMKTLNYAGIIIATDQDIDGIGNITSLILVYMITFWPALVKRGYCKRLATPLVRAYCGKKVINFYSEKEFNTWVHSFDILPKNYDIRYYKGLAGHSEEEMLKDIGANPIIYTFTYDDATLKKMEIMYGKESALRKLELATPLKDEEVLDLKVPLKKCSSHFEIESKTFQLAFINRKMKNAVDGLIPSQRKAFAAARIYFKKESRVKVYQLTGYLTNAMKYQHGDTSMNETIIKMAQIFTGSNQVPPFMPISTGFGSRREGRGKTGSPRYIDIGYNGQVMNILFPPQDDHLLIRNREDGVLVEPLYYCPIMPYAILETSTTTSVGWKIDIWARDFFVVLLKLRLRIRFDIDGPSLWGHPFAPDTMKITTKYGSHPVEICTGSYKRLNRKMLQITELPFKVWSSKLKEKYLYIPEIKEITDKTADDEVNLLIEANPEFLDKMDPMDYFGLEQKLATNMNLVKILEHSDKLVVGEFKSYDEIFDYWYDFRKDLYKERIKRSRIYISLKLLFYKNIRNFIEYEEYLGLNIKLKEDDEREAILTEYGIQKINKALLFNSNAIPTESLKDKILNFEASFSYIDDIKEGEKSKKKVAELEEKIKKYVEKLAKINLTEWHDLWLEELTALEAAYKEGRASGFLYQKHEHVFSSQL